ncbi:helix-turn-helix transcriptional regulator [Bacillus safensis]|uniref:helix-turn-helix domain-containing protein n=1 Tax=Bacillus TaxID=1386 RepID=UPI00064C60DA|nr:MULTISPECIES: helix-turn-helix transcriptional regulator [Bacillus]KLV14074.1 transcriptional regulator [Bacillus altitudinis]MEC4586511.1 helix-turn-helix transcriptional regulator [Bacillus safensis]MEC4626297.1 helix-turn-helix transcriptional regulator [Bacillus safensis]
MARKRLYFAKCRKEKGTQQFVAKENGISTVYLRMIENGTFTPGRDLMFQLCRYFDQPADKLFPDYFNNQSLKHTLSDN